jgi:hypothetical protein
MAKTPSRMAKTPEKLAKTPKNMAKTVPVTANKPPEPHNYRSLSVWGGQNGGFVHER